MNALSLAGLLTPFRAKSLMLLPFCDLPDGLFLLLKIPKVSPAPDLQASPIKDDGTAHPSVIVPPSSSTHPGNLSS
jgi:hypothetical protein